MNSRILEGIDYASDDRNFKYDFKKMTKLYGKDFIILLKAMYEANDSHLLDQEFCILNGIEQSFLDKVIKCK